MPPHNKTYDPSILGRQLGILRIAVEDSTTGPQYVWRGRPRIQGGVSFDQLGVTVDRREALIVCFMPSTEPHAIGCLVGDFAGRVAQKPPHAFL